MSWFFIGILNLILTLSPAVAQNRHSSALTSQASKALQISRTGWDLRKKIDAFYRVEPYLHPNPHFGSIQNWTLKNQRYYQTHGQIFRQILVTDPRYVSVDLVKRAYEKYISKLNELVQELPAQVDLHMALIEDENFRQEILFDIKKTLQGISSRNLTSWTLTCDYIAQPILTIWYLTVAIEHLHKVGRFKEGAAWDRYSADFLQKNRFFNVGQILAKLPAAYSAALPD